MKKISFVTAILGMSFFGLLMNPSISFAQSSEVKTEIATVDLQKIKNNAFQQLWDLKVSGKLSIKNLYSAVDNLNKAESEKDVYLVLVSIEGTNEYNQLAKAKNSVFQQLLNYSSSDKLNKENLSMLIAKLQLANSGEEVNLVASLAENLVQEEQDLKVAKNTCFQKAFNYSIKGQISNESLNSIIERLQKANSKEEVNEIMQELEQK